jgi:hypothetical protein
VSAMPADPVVRPAVWGTVAFTAASIAAVTAGGAVALSAAVFDGVLFALGVLVFVRTFLVAAERSRTEELSVAGIWFLSGSAPKEVRAWLLGCLAAQTAVALVAASLRPYTALAFGILVPVFGLAMCGLWAVRSGTFPPRSSRRTD